MSQVASAGAFITAVMETAGYITQAGFLVDFREFFRDAGALIYLMAGMGGVFSMAVFGSFRAARYLILGPALFWFLIGPTETVSGVVWRIGDGSARGYEGITSEDDSLSDVRETLSDGEDGTIDGGQAVGRFGGDIEVAYFFRLFTRAINSITQGLMGEVLRHEDDADLYAISRMQGLETLIMQGAEDSAFLHLVTHDLMKGCYNMVGYAIMRAQPTISHEMEEIHRRMGQEETAELIKNHRQVYTEKFIWAATHDTHSPSKYMKDYMRRRAEAGDDSTAGDVHNKKGGHVHVLGCSTVWDIVVEALMDHAEVQKKKVAEAGRGLLPADGSYDDEVCATIIEKLVPEDWRNHETWSGGLDCDQLVPFMAIFYIKNALLKVQTMDTVLNRHINNATFVNPVHNGEVWGFDEDGSKLVMVGGLQDFQPVAEYGPDLDGDGKDDVIGYKVAFQKTTYDERTGKPTVTTVHRPAAILNHIGGPFDGAFGSQQRMQTRALRQSIFTWALHLPYYQGVLLYLIAAAYPFMALIVLVPGRALGFMNVPLAWLWIKSWDVGFALVIILERALWNLTPNADIADELRQETALGINQLPSLLTEALKIDPSYNIHSYYMIISIALFAIPILSGYATLKAKKSILASFHEAPMDQAKDAGGRAGGAYLTSVQNERVRAMMELTGFAATMSMWTGEGVGTDGNAYNQDAKRVAAKKATTTALREGMSKAVPVANQAIGGARDSRAGSKAASEVSSDDKYVKAGDPDVQHNPGKIDWVGHGRRVGNAVIQTGGTVYKEYYDTDFKMRQAYTNLHRNQYAAWHPQFGRWGRLQMMSDAYYASMDGGQSYEINDNYANATDQLLEFYKTRILDIGVGMVKDVVKAVAHGTNLVPGGPGYKQAVVASVVGYLLNDDTNRPALAEEDGWFYDTMMGTEETIAPFMYQMDEQVQELDDITQAEGEEAALARLQAMMMPDEDEVAQDGKINPPPGGGMSVF